MLKEDGVIFVKNKEAAWPSMFPSIEAIIKTVEEAINRD